MDASEKDWRDRHGRPGHGVLTSVTRVQSWKGMNVESDRVCTHILSNYPAEMILDDPSVPLAFSKEALSMTLTLKWYPYVAIFGILRRKLDKYYVHVVILMDRAKPDIAGKAYEFTEWLHQQNGPVGKVLEACRKKNWMQIDSVGWNQYEKSADLRFSAGHQHSQSLRLFYS